MDKNTAVKQHNKGYKKLAILLSSLLLLITLWAFSPSGGGRLFEISKNLEIYNTLFKELNTYYVDEIDPGKLMRTGVDAMLGTLDPYTNYISESQIERYRYMTEGRYNGIGAVIYKIDNQFTIVEPHEGSPAFEAGLRAGDILLSVDGQSLEGRDIEELGTFLRGAPNTKMTLSLRRPGQKELVTAEVTRNEIEIPNVPYHGMVDPAVGYINLTTFTPDASKNIANALRELKRDNPGMQGIIIDLRENGGGLLREAVNISNIFIPKDQEVVVTKGKVKDWDQSFKTTNNPMDEQIPLVVLINKRSASASEIVSGVIQDLDRGILVGQRSYGKGLVQNTKEIGYNAKVKLTTAKYYIPSGRCIQSVSYKDGEPVDIADAMRTPFKTRNGRRVLDGGGVTPDVVLEEPKLSPFAQYLRDEFYIFRYVTEWSLKNKTIDSPSVFKFNQYDEFVKFILDKKPNYVSESEKALETLKAALETDQYSKLTDADVKALEKKIKKNLQTELEKNRADIITEIERDIITRNYHQRGKIIYTLDHDTEVVEAVNVIKDKDRYAKILKPK